MTFKSSRKGRVRGTRKTVVDGITFDSLREANRYAGLKTLERTGHIRDLELQVKIELKGENDHIKTPTGRKMAYFADFRYFDNDLQCWVIEDAKGYPTDVYKMKKAILLAMGVEIKEV